MNRRKFLQLSGVNTLTINDGGVLSSLVDSSKSLTSSILSDTAYSPEELYVRKSIEYAFQKSLIYVNDSEINELAHYFSSYYVHPEDQPGRASSILYNLNELSIYYDDKWEPLRTSVDDGLCLEMVKDFYREFPNIMKNLSLNTHKSFLNFTEYVSVASHVDEDILRDYGIEDIRVERTRCSSSGEYFTKYYYKNSRLPACSVGDTGFGDLNILDALMRHHKSNIASIQGEFYKSILNFNKQEIRQDLVDWIPYNSQQINQIILQIMNSSFKNKLGHMLVGENNEISNITTEPLLLENIESEEEL